MTPESDETSEPKEIKLGLHNKVSSGLPFSSVIASHCRTPHVPYKTANLPIMQN